MLLSKKAKEVFGIDSVGSDQLSNWVNECVAAYQGNPCWIDSEEHIDTVVFAKAICSEVARLVTLGIGIHTGSSARAQWLQEQIDSIYYEIRKWVEYSCAYGTIILKPNNGKIDLYFPSEFEITSSTDGIIDGVIFHNWKKVEKKWYTLLEYHRFDGDKYLISNRCFVGNSKDDTKKPVDIKNSPWAGIEEEASLSNIKHPLFGVLKTPGANNIDIASPYGLPIFSEAMQELRDLDIAYSRNAKEILDSKRIVLLDSDRLLAGNKRKNQSGNITLPDFVKIVDSTGGIDSDVYHEINPEINTEMRLKGINYLLSQIGYKTGFANGHFVFNEQSGIQTATGVEANQQRTIQFVKDCRDALEKCMSELIYGINSMADLYERAPSGSYEIVFNFGDITYNQEEDKATWRGYVTQGWVPKWMYFVKFEGMTEDEAKAMVAEAEPKQPSLFGSEE